MNILPKKRWHVRNQDNKERVRRDLENARLEEKKEHERITLAEKEVRISLLRKKNNVDISSEQKAVSHGHINLFSTEEEAGSSGIKKDNIDYIKEKNAEKESYEKKIGLLTYVGQSSLEAKDDGKLWYTEKKAKKRKTVNSDVNSDDDEVDQIKKSRLDPLMVVDKHMKHKRSKKKKKKKHNDNEKSSAKKSIEQLRAERLKRESAEKQRAQLLLTDKLSPKITVENPNNSKYKYNSQYNPDVARRK